MGGVDQARQMSIDRRAEESGIAPLAGFARQLKTYV